LQRGGPAGTCTLELADHEPSKREWPSIVLRAEPLEAAKSRIAQRQSVDGTLIA